MNILKNIKSIILVYACLTSVISVSQAQTVITLNDALQYALKNNTAIAKAKMEIESGLLAEKEIRASAYPQIDLVSNVTYNYLVQQFVLPAEFMGGEPGQFIAIKAGQTWNAMTQVQMSQQLFNKQLFTGLKAARSSRDFYLLSARVAEENLIQQVAVNYYQVIITGQNLEVIDANLDRLTRLETMLRRQVELGLVRKIDLDRVIVNKNNLLAQKEELDYGIIQQTNLLKYYMGMPVSEEIVLAETSLTELENEILPYSVNYDFNITNLTQYELLRKQGELLELNVDAKKSEYYPSLSLSANYVYSTQSDKFNIYSKNALGFDIGGVTLNLRVPIFDGNARKFRVEQSKLDIIKLNEDIRDTDNALRMANENAKIMMKNSLRTITTQKSNKDFAEEVLKSTQGHYENGLANLTDLMNAETEFVTAQNSYNQALLNFKIAQIELIKSNGNIKSILND